MNTRRIFAAISLVMMAFLLTTVAFAQQDPTPIPILPDVEDDSAAPTLEPLATFVPPVPQGNAGTGQQPAVQQPAGAACPVNVSENFTATEFRCEGLSGGQACLGSGSITTAPAGGNPVTFDAPGDITPFTTLNQLTLDTSGSANREWSVVTGQLSLPRTVEGTIPAQFVAFGDVTIIDTGESVSGQATQGTVLAGRGLNVRRTPDNTGTVVYQLTSAESVLVTGITPDRTWLRIEIPSGFGGVGWVYAPYMNVDGGTDTLQVVTAQSPAPQLTPPEFGPMQSFLLITSDIPNECGDAIPDSGIILQTTSGTAGNVRARINGTIIELNGTAYIRSSDALFISVAEGEATVIAQDAPTVVRAGNQATVPLTADGLEPAGAVQVISINRGIFASLPTNLLERAVNTSAVSIPSAGNTGGGFATPTPFAGSATSGFATPTPSAATGDAATTAPIATGPQSLSSSSLGALTCPGGRVRQSVTSSGGVFVEIGGTWTATAGTTITFNAQGGEIQAEFPDYIRLVSSDGNVLAASGTDRSLTLTLSQSVTFNAQFSAAPGNLVIVSASCGLPG